MKKTALITIMMLTFCGLFSSTCTASWLYFYKPEFKGRILDAETKEPIQGAVVVAVYNTHLYGIGDSGTSEIGVRETLTDEKGEFHIPSYFTIINPFSVEEKTSFIIYKPGYKSYPGMIYPIVYFGNFAEDYFTREIGERAEAIKSDVTMEKITIAYGIVELPKIRMTRENRLRAMPVGPSDFGSDDLPLLFKAINKENKKLGRGEER